MIGDGTNTLLWNDPWVNKTPLLVQFGAGSISLMESTSLAKVETILDNGTWSLGSFNHVMAIDLRHAISQIHIGRRDDISWDGLSAPWVTLSYIWNTIRRTGVNQIWAPAVWHSLAIPKCSIFLWLALRDRLLTKDRLSKFGFHTFPTCVLCGAADESSHHLLVDCSFMLAIFQHSPFPIERNWPDLIGTGPNNFKAQLHCRGCPFGLV